MRYTEKCPKCGKTVTVNTVESGPAVVGGKSYLIKCNCGADIRTISSRECPTVTNGYAEIEC